MAGSNAMPPRAVPVVVLVAPLLARRRIVDIERRFFDAYGRGGTQDPRELVIPLDYLARPEVERALRRWWRGKPLDVEALHRSWRAGSPDGDERLFYRNLAFLLAQAGRG